MYNNLCNKGVMHVYLYIYTIEKWLMIDEWVQEEVGLRVLEVDEEATL